MRYIIIILFFCSQFTLAQTNNIDYDIDKYNKLLLTTTFRINKDGLIKNAKVTRVECVYCSLNELTQDELKSETLNSLTKNKNFINAIGQNFSLPVSFFC